MARLKGNNVERADRAMRGFTAYAHRLGQNPKSNEKHELMGDFLGDLMHLCQRLNIDFDECLRRGVEYYEYELKNPSE